MKSRSDRKPPLFAASPPPPRHTEPNFGLTNFPLQCDTTLFSRPPLSGASESRGSWDMRGQRAKPWQCALPPRVVSGRGGSLYLHSAHPGWSNPDPQGAKYVDDAESCCPLCKMRKFTQCFAALVFSTDFQPSNLFATRNKTAMDICQNFVTYFSPYFLMELEQHVALL